MTMSADDLFREIRRITATLDSLDEEDPSRAALIARRDDLRQAARSRHTAMASPGALQRELAHLRARLAALDGERIEIPTWQRRLGGIVSDPAASGREINRRIDAFNAPKRETLEQRITEIETLLGGPGEA